MFLGRASWGGGGGGCKGSQPHQPLGTASWVSHTLVTPSWVPKIIISPNGFVTSNSKPLLLGLALCVTHLCPLVHRACTPPLIKAIVLGMLLRVI